MLGSTTMRIASAFPSSSDGDTSPELVVKELQHRIRNLLSVVQCLVSNTEADTADGLRNALAARLENLSDAYRLIEGASTHRVCLAVVLERTLRPHAGRMNDRVILDGPDVLLEPQWALTLHMIFHELATNACKHGSLSAASGSVEVLWDVVPRLGGQQLAVQWRERGGPVVGKPGYMGFGLRLFARLLPGTPVDMDFAPAGLICRFLVELGPP